MVCCCKKSTGDLYGITPVLNFLFSTDRRSATSNSLSFSEISQYLVEGDHPSENLPANVSESS